MHIRIFLTSDIIKFREKHPNKTNQSMAHKNMHSSAELRKLPANDRGVFSVIGTTLAFLRLEI